MKKSLLFLNLFFLTVSVFAQTPRLSLFEEFTGETCGPCAAANPLINATMAMPINYKRVVPVKWQVPIPSAPTNTWSLYQTNKIEINWRYRSVAAGGYGYNNGAGIGSAPTMQFDGWMQNAATTQDCAAAQSYTSAFSITMDRSWDATQSAVNLTVSIQATANFTATGNLVFRTVMVERIIQFTTQPGNNGETEFHDVAIKSFPTLQGGVSMASNWIIGQTQTFTLNCPLPSYTRKKEEVAFAGFIQDDGNRKVAQAVRAEKQGIGLNDAEVISLSCSPGMVCNTGPISPVVVMRNNGTNTITSFIITPFLDAVAQPPVSWSGTLNNGAYKTIVLPSFTTNISGSHNFSCKISNVSGIDSDSLNNQAITSFFVGTNATNTQVAEGFVGAFPPVKWGILNPDEGTAWVKSTSAGGFNLSSESAFYQGIFNNNRGDVDEMILPPLDLSGTAAPLMTFDVAYARRYYRSDTLEVLASSNCGSTWTLVYQKQDSILSTIQYAMASSFTPAANQWRNETISLPGFNQPNVLVKFRVKNDAGNNIYVDNVNVTQPQPTNVRSQSFESSVVNVYPNPASDILNISYSLQTNEQLIKARILNNLGQIIKEEELQNNSIGIKDLPDGIYILNLRNSNSYSISKRFIIAH